MSILRRIAITAALVLLAAPAAAEGVGADETPPTRIDSVADLGRYFATACRDPDLERARVDVTARLSLRADGSLFGAPVVTRAVVPRELKVTREMLRARIAATYARCLPAPLSAAFGRSFAGRPIAHRMGVRTPLRPRPPFPPGGRAI